MASSARRDLAILLLVCVVAFWWGIGRVGLIDPDEPFYAESAREMLARHERVAPYIFGHPQFEKPILFYWLEMISFSAFGRSEGAARAPAALFGTLLTLLTYAFGARAFGRRVGFLAALVLATSVIFCITSRMVLTDSVFAFFVCAACLACAEAVRAERARPGLWHLAFACSALAALTKGPLGFLIPLLATGSYARLSGARSPAPARTLLSGAALGLAIAAPWYGAMFARYGWLYFRSFFIHENWQRFVAAEHPANNHLPYYAAVLIAGSVPWLPVLVVAVARWRPPGGGDRVTRYLDCWIASSLAFFTVAQSKLPTYILFVFVPTSLRLGMTLDSLLRQGFQAPAERRIALAAAVLQIAGIVIFMAFPDSQPFYVPLALVGLCLCTATAMQWRRPTVAWLWSSALATLALVGGLTTWAARPLESRLSMKSVASQVSSITPGTEPILATPTLIRGLYYYSGIPPRVLSRRPRAFYSPHPIPVVVGASELQTFVRGRGPTRCVLRASEWRALEGRLTSAAPDDSVLIGDKIVVRLRPTGTAQEPARPTAPATLP